MDSTQVLGFLSELEGIYKEASLVQHGLEVGGLGALAVPSVKTLKSKGSTPKEKNHAKWELGGLGVLAAHPAYSLLKRAGIIRAPVKPALATSAIAKMRQAITPTLKPGGPVMGAARPPGLGSQTIKAPMGHPSMVSGGRLSGWVDPRKATGMDRIRAAGQQDLKPLSAKVR
jgi:hypothetical protein